MRDVIINSPMFGLLFSVLAYLIGLKINAKLKTPFANPLFIALTIIITMLGVFNISYESFNIGGSAINAFLVPATCALGMSIYRQIETLKKNFLPVICGCTVGAIVSVATSIILCNLFGLNNELVSTMIPRAATSPIAMDISASLNGIPSVTVAAAVFSGIMGAVFCPILIKILKLKNKVAIGVGIGTSSSAAGTAKALEIGETEGAMSSLSIGITGLITTLIALFI